MKIVLLFLLAGAIMANVWVGYENYLIYAYGKCAIGLTFCIVLAVALWYNFYYYEDDET